MSAAVLNPQHLFLPASLRRDFERAADSWTAEDRTGRLWRRDATLWTGADEGRWLGWLDAPERAATTLGDLGAFAAEVVGEGFTHALLLGMGGSSLAPEVLRLTFGHRPGWPDLQVLDSTVPAQVAGVEARIDPARTLAIVASKSGSTLEPNLFKQYFFERIREAVGPVRVGRHFVAITDPGSQLEEVAGRDGFRRVFPGDPSIGGRFSALSPFGLVPAAVMGLDVARLVAEAAAMADACRARDAAANPGVALGLVLGLAALAGRDKLTIVTSPEIFDLGAWLEQLVAESTGKQGRAIIPVDLERLGSPDVYGDDRVFAWIRLSGQPDRATEDAVGQLAAAGHPVISIEVRAAEAIAQEFFRWEIATAVAGAILGINPFDQPDVESAKVATRALTRAFEEAGSLPQPAPILVADGLSFFTDDVNARVLGASTADPAALLRAHLDRLGPRDYFALLAFVEMTATHQESLQEVRHLVGRRYRVATALGFGPRYLHSTGQAYKGGPNTGVFLQVTSDDARDLPVPGRKYSFGVVKAAQAAGDLQVLLDRGRRALRVHVPGEVARGLAQLAGLVARALG